MLYLVLQRQLEKWLRGRKNIWRKERLSDTFNTFSVCTELFSFFTSMSHIAMKIIILVHTTNSAEKEIVQYLSSYNTTGNE